MPWTHVKLAFTLIYKVSEVRKPAYHPLPPIREWEIHIAR